MEAHDWKDLFLFCEKYSSIVCYGASDHGYMVKHFLEKHHIDVCAFLITDAVRNDEYREGIPVYSVKDIHRIPPHSGIVLSLFEQHHPQVISDLHASGWRDGIYPLSNHDLLDMRTSLLFMEREEVLFAGGTSTEIEAKEYDRRCQHIFQRYSYVECRFIDVWRLGSFSIWLCHVHRNQQSHPKYFCLYYPVTHEHQPDERLKGANGYLLSKLQDDGIEAVSFANLKFWQFVFAHYRDKCRLSEEYDSVRVADRRIFPYLDQMPIHKRYISFTDDEETEGRKDCRDMGIHSPYICISNRDIAFLQTEKRDALKPDFRDRYRNSEISNHEKAIDYLAQCHIQTVRMGAIAMQEFHCPNMIDYVHQYRTEFMDVYLAAGCKFFVGDLSGILVFPMFFSKPMVIVNAPLLTTLNDAPLILSPEKDIALLKKLWDKKNGRYLTLSDMLSMEASLCAKQSNASIAWTVFEEYDRRGIVPIDNTKEEIFAVVKEMNQRIDGTIIYDEIDKKLQDQYRSIVDCYPMKKNMVNRWRLGKQFLRENSWLLD